MPVKLLFLVILIGASQAKKLFNLKDFRAENDSQINAVAPYSLYISATSDSKDLLSKVFVTSDGQKTSLANLKLNKAQSPFSFSLPFRVNSEAVIGSELTAAQMKSLTGFLYTTASGQMNGETIPGLPDDLVKQSLSDNSFYVFDVTKSTRIQVDETKYENCTLVFLNSDMSTKPVQSSVISKWNQSGSVFVYQGIPSTDPMENNTHIFSNPVSTTNGMRFFERVEQFSVSLPTFYMRTHNDVGFSILSNSLNLNMSRTFELSTTGFYMKPFNEPDQNITVVTMRTATDFTTPFNKTVGANIRGDMPRGSTVTVEEKESHAMDGCTVKPTDKMYQFSTPNIGWNITFSSSNASEGQFFVQYYILGYGYKYN